MYAAIIVYDKEIKELLSKLNKKARNFDKEKYGLPPKQNLEGIVYDWLYKYTQKLKEKSNE